jgi:hypothetical protein
MEMIIQHDLRTEKASSDYVAKVIYDGFKQTKETCRKSKVVFKFFQINSRIL